MGEWAPAPCAMPFLILGGVDKGSPVYQLAPAGLDRGAALDEGPTKEYINQ